MIAGRKCRLTRVACSPLPIVSEYALKHDHHAFAWQRLQVCERQTAVPQLEAALPVNFRTFKRLDAHALSRC